MTGTAIIAKELDLCLDGTKRKNPKPETRFIDQFRKLLERQENLLYSETKYSGCTMFEYMDF